MVSNVNKVKINTTVLHGLVSGSANGWGPFTFCTITFGGGGVWQKMVLDGGGGAEGVKKG